MMMIWMLRIRSVGLNVYYTIRIFDRIETTTKTGEGTNMTSQCGDCKHFEENIDFETSAKIKDKKLCGRIKSGYTVLEADPACEQFEEIL